jgi:F0F1-type ATP synthase epsilon subunit
MYCKIQSPDALIFEGEIKELRLPTQYGDKHITSIKEMEYYVVKPGIVIVDII